jgi:hypothetical protein
MPMRFMTAIDRESVSVVNETTSFEPSFLKPIRKHALAPSVA